MPKAASKPPSQAVPKVKPPQGRKGPPFKKTELAMERALRIAKTGLPLKFAAAAASVTTEALLQWRKTDPVFNEAFEQARLEAVEKRWQTILKASEAGLPGSWQASAWALERSNPSEFGRPEIQLNAQFNSSQTTVNNTLIISVEAADRLAARAKPIEKEVDELIARRLKEREAAVPVEGTNGQQIREVESSLVQTGPITLPHPQTASWWKSLTSGSGDREITPEAAEFVLRTIAVDALGSQRASGVKIDLDGGGAESASPLTLRDVWNALADLCGPFGWQVLTRRGEQ
jgi:hypothetical protein